MASGECCVGGCASTDRTHQLYKIPTNEKLRKLWLTFLVPTNAELSDLTKEQLLNKRVCQNHFECNQNNSKRDCSCNGYASLFSSPTITCEIALNLSVEDHLSDHNYFRQTLDECREGAAVFEGATDLSIEYVSSVKTVSGLSDMKPTSVVAGTSNVSQTINSVNSLKSSLTERLQIVPVVQMSIASTVQPRSVPLSPGEARGLDRDDIKVEILLEPLDTGDPFDAGLDSGCELNVSVCKEEPEWEERDRLFRGSELGQWAQWSTWDVPLDIVKDETEHSGASPAKRPRLDPHKYHADIASGHIKRSDDTEETEQPKAETNSIHKDKPDEGNDIVQTCDKVEHIHKYRTRSSGAKPVVHQSVKPKPYQCDTCQKCFRTKESLRYHKYRFHYSECDVCKKLFIKKCDCDKVDTNGAKPKPYQCDTCQKCFRTKESLRHHKYRFHYSECDVCKKRFGEKCDLSHHIMLKHTGEKPFECHVCKKRFINKSCLSIHMRTHTGEKPFKCDVCNKRFIRKSCLPKHMRTHTGENPFKCDVCKKRFIRKSCLSKHMRTHTGEKPFECYVCKKRFAVKYQLHMHINLHTGIFECNICKKRCSKKSKLISHIRIHTGEKPFECNVCKKRFAQKIYLKRHIYTHRINTDVNYGDITTGHIKRSGNTEENLFGEEPTVHQSVHNQNIQEPKSYLCDICQKCFNTQPSLNAHKNRMHSGREKLLECDVCKMRFMHMSHLSRHMRTHTGEKPNECHVCKKRFNEKWDLIKHFRIHIGEKPYECEVCRKRFVTKYQLISHSRVHTDEKPYECNICEHRFRHRNALGNHVRSHTGERPYECDVCKKCFTQKGHLFRHIRLHTGEKRKKNRHENALVGDANAHHSSWRSEDINGGGPSAAKRPRLDPHKYLADITSAHIKRSSDTEETEQPKAEINSIHEDHSYVRNDIVQTCDKVDTQLNKYKGNLLGDKPVVHQRVHNQNVQELKLYFSQKYSSTESQLYFHKYCMHSGREKLFECDVCNKRFMSMSHLAIHMRTHVVEKPYKCNVCKKRFSAKDALDIHTQSHTGVRPHQCHICKKSFNKKCYLLKHIRIHTGEKLRIHDKPDESTYINEFYDKVDIQTHK